MDGCIIHYISADAIHLTMNPCCAAAGEVSNETCVRACADDIVLRALSSLPEVISVCPMDRPTLDAAFSLESEARSEHMEFENRALLMSKECSEHVFVLAKHQFDPAPHIPMVMLDESDDTVGFFASPTERNQYREGDGFRWVTDSMVVTDNIHSPSRIRMVSVPQYLTVIGREQGVRNAMAFLPSIKTDAYLRERYCSDSPRGSLTFIVSYDPL